ncbi:4Fe-4S binding protein [Thermogladius sp. 4427co]|uniref:4Fe-4S binding protein n=1 Tax=Thermogladius sp. 4427co TaxID=3450718 RepID=UPI003F78C385
MSRFFKSIKELFNLLSVSREERVTEPIEKLVSEELERVRGVPRLIPEKCTGCSLCAMVCPTGAIQMVPTSNTPVAGKTRAAKIPVFNYGRCIYCAMCSQACRFNAIEMRKEILYYVREKGSEE